MPFLLAGPDGDKMSHDPLCTMLRWSAGVCCILSCREQLLLSAVVGCAAAWQQHTVQPAVVHSRHAMQSTQITQLSAGLKHRVVIMTDGRPKRTVSQSKS
jgi:hypothetical protein